MIRPQARKLLGFLIATAVLSPAATSASDAALPPPPWIVQNIGGFVAPGIAEVDAAGRWTLVASPGQSFSGLDAFFSVHQPLLGDGSVLALLLGQEGGHPQWGRAGITILEPGSVRGRGAHLWMTRGRGLTFAYRAHWVRPLVMESGERRYAPRHFPIWLRLQREGDRLTPFLSEDGYGWTQIRAPISLWNLPRQMIAGLSVASSGGEPARAFFSTPLVSPGRLSPLVQARSGNGAVLLAWAPVANARGYLIRRSDGDTAGFAADLITHRPIAATAFTDTTPMAGTPARYLVSALFPRGADFEEGWPTSVRITPVAVPEGLVGGDLNPEAPHLLGGITFDPATTVYRIWGTGAGFGGETDRGYFASRLIEGDFQITVRILERPGGVAGLMLRETLDGASRMSFFGSAGPRGLVFWNRLQAGTPTRMPVDPVLAESAFRSPLYLRLVRRGNSVIPLVSRDGRAFQSADSAVTFNPPLSRGVYVGYAIASQNPEVTVESLFSDLTVTTP